MIQDRSDDQETLRDRLVEVALKILAEEGIEALTLRSVARRAGVSHGAPARHFNNLSDLRAEVAAVGYRLLSEAVDQSSSLVSGEADPGARLNAAGRAYLDCALANPGLFALMFRRGDLSDDNPSLARDASTAFEGLLVHVQFAQAAGWKTATDSKLLAGALWASIHGLATLWLQGAYQEVNPDASLEDAVAQLMTLSGRT